MVHRSITSLALAVCAALLPACRCDEQAPRPGPPAPDQSGPPAGAAQDWRALYDRWEYPDPIPPFALMDHRGQRFTLADFRDHYVLLGFIYTRCPLPEACPLTTEKMRRVQTRWSDLAARGETRGRTLRLLSVTLDPDHDTPERLAAYAAERGLELASPAWTLATGPEELVTNALPSLFNVLALPRGPGDVQHTVKVALLAPGLTLAREWKDNDFTADEVIAAVLAHRSASTTE